MGVLGRLLPRCVVKSTLLDVLGRLDINSAIDVWVRQHAEHGLNDVLDLLVGEPLLLAQHLLAHQPVLDVGVVDGRPELELRELERKLLGEVDVDDKLEALVGTADGPLNDDLPVEKVLLQSGYDSPKLGDCYCSFISAWMVPNYFSSLFIASL